MAVLFEKTILLSLIIGHQIQLNTAQVVRGPMDRDRYDFEFVYNYTKYLHGIYRFNSFVTFSHYEALRRPNFIMVRSFEQALVEDFNVPIIACGRQSPAKLRHLIGLNNMVFVQFNSMNDSILESVDQTLEGLHFITMLFFYKHQSNKLPTAAEIRQFFAWCWFRNMINVALTFQVIQVTVLGPKGNPLFHNNADVYVQNQVYTYTPFPELTVQNLTREVAQGKGEYTTDRITNVNGYVFRTPTYPLPPYVFLDSLNNHCDGKKYCTNSLTGVAGHILKEYINQINGTIELELFNPHNGLENFVDVLLAPAKRKADIVPNPISELILSKDFSAGSYPIAQTNLCIIVPVKQEMERQLYIPQAFQAEIWFFVLLSFLLLFGAEICYNFQSINARLQRLSDALIAAINLLLDQPNIIGSANTLWRFYKIYHLIIALATFVLTNMFSASLTSLLSTAPYGVQIDTVAQFLASDLKIMTTVSERKLFFETNRLPVALIPKLRLVNTTVMEQHRNALNVSFAYLATAEIWRLINNQQQHLRKPLFRMPGRELCTTTFFLRFPVQWDSPFTLSLAIFFMATQESGFALKWRDMSTYQSKQFNFTKVNEKDSELWTPLSMQHFILPIYFVGVLWLLAITCFGIEILWHYIKDVKQRSNKSMSLLKKYSNWKRPRRRYYGKFYKAKSEFSSYYV